MTTRHDRRAGSTLTEVLVSLFVMAARMTALLTLFPLGALKIAQMVKDDRTAQTAGQADATMRMYWKANIEQSVNDQVLPLALIDPRNPNPQSEPQHPATFSTAALSFVISNPPTLTPSAANMPRLQASENNRASYPVLVDPLGDLARINAEKLWVGQRSYNPGPYTGPMIPRRTLGMMTPVASPPAPRRFVFQPFNSAQAFGNCSLIEDLAFNTNGEAFYDRATQPPSAAASNTRQGIYNWAAMIQRPRNGDRTTATMTILVFDGRPPLLAVDGDETVIPNTNPFVNTSVGSWTVGNRDVTLTIPLRSTDLPPLIRRGGWIMDGTIHAPNNVRNANFYRIAGMTEIVSNVTPPTVTYSLDLETPIKPDNGTATAPPNARQIYLFAGLSEVFERPPLTADNFVQP